MAGQGTVTVRILGDEKDLKRALSSSDSALGSFSDKTKEVGGKITSAGAKMTAGLTLPILGVGVAAFGMASDLNESISKVGVVFGENARVIEAWADDAAKNLGLSKQKALEAAGTFGTLFKSMGVTADHAGMLSTDLVQLAADLASFNNANPEEVLENLRAGLLGEAEPLRKFGVQLSATRIEAEALSMGLVAGAVDAEKFSQAQIGLEKAQIKAAEALKVGGVESLAYRDATADVATAEAKLAEITAGKVPELNAAQKAQAALSVIMKDTALAQGDFGRTADGAANKQRILKAQFEDTAAVIGQKLMPVGMKILEWVGKLATAFTNLSPHMQDMVLIGAAVAAAIGPLTTIIGGIVTAVGALISPVALAVIGVAALAAALVYAYTQCQTFRDVVDNVVVAAIAFGTTLRDFLAPLVDFIRGHTDEFKTALIALGVFVGGSLMLTLTTLGIAIAAVTVAVIAVTTVALAFTDALRWLWEKAEPVRNVLGEIASVVSGVLVGAFGQMSDTVSTVAGGLQALWDKAEGLRGFLADAFRLGIDVGRSALDALRGAVDAVVGAIQWLIDKVQWLIDKIPSIPSLPSLGGGDYADAIARNRGSASGGGMKIDGGRAGGGPVLAGRSYLVGERGPELLTMGANGNVITADEVLRAKRLREELEAKRGGFGVDEDELRRLNLSSAAYSMTAQYRQELAEARSGVSLHKKQIAANIAAAGHDIASNRDAASSISGAGASTSSASSDICITIEGDLVLPNVTNKTELFRELQKLSTRNGGLSKLISVFS